MRGAGEVKVSQRGKRGTRSQRMRGCLPGGHQIGTRRGKRRRGMFPPLESVTKSLAVGWGYYWSAGSLIGKTRG